MKPKKHKRWLYMSAALLVLAGCNDDWNEDKLDGFKRPEVTDIKKIEYTLLDADYKAIATNKTNKALAESLGLSDALSKLTNDKYFTDEIPASKFMPAFLSDTYPTADDKSAVKVTYSKLVGEPEYLATIGGAKHYQLTADDYAKVWGETRKAKSEYLSQLHTDYHNEVGCKYGLARGIPYNELSEEEKRGRRHKNKVVLEAERQAKSALEKVEKYAVLATIDKQELTFPLLNIKTPVQEAMNTVNKEFAIPVPALIGQKTWREERTTNINDAIKALVTAVNVERDKQNNGIRASVNKTYTYYMQQLNKLIGENKALRNENDTLKAENTEVKQHISQLDENAVRRVTAQKDAVIESLNTQLASKNEDNTKLKTEYNTLWEKYKILVLQWNDLTKQPEIIEAVKRVEERKEQEAEAKREEQARQDRYQGVLDRFISEGHEQLKAFSQSSRIDFDEKEAKAIYYGIMATATKSNIALRSPQGAKFAVERFLASMDWNGCGNYRRECIAHWTKLFATDEVVYTEPIIQNFLSFIDYMSCSADTYVSLGGSNGCADQLTNWDGTQKIGLGAPSRKKSQGLSR